MAFPKLPHLRKRPYLSARQALELVRDYADRAREEQERLGLAFALVSADDIDAIIVSVDPKVWTEQDPDHPDLSPDERSRIWFDVDPSLQGPVQAPPAKQRHRDNARRPSRPRRG